MAIVVFLVVALVLSACAPAPTAGPAPAPQAAPGQAAQPGAQAPADAAKPSAPAAAAPQPAAQSRQAPPRVRVESYTPGQPTLIFFDADGWPFCDAMWPVVYGTKQQTGERVQIVILDYYNPKVDALKRQYRVFGHPTFVFVDAQGQEKARIVGLTSPERVADAFATIGGS